MEFLLDFTQVKQLLEAMSLYKLILINPDSPPHTWNPGSPPFPFV